MPAGPQQEKPAVNHFTDQYLNFMKPIITHPHYQQSEPSSKAIQIYTLSVAETNQFLKIGSLLQ